MSDKIMVTGGAGFVGTHLVRELTERGYEVFSFDIKNDPHQDITNYEAIKRYIMSWKPDIVFHLAANPRVDLSFKNTIRDFEVNVLGTLNLLRALKDRPVKLVFTSTAHVYGEPCYLPIDEAHPISPRSPYAISKYAAERYCLVYGRKHGIQVTIIRLFNTYGPGQGPGFVIPDLVHKLVKNPNRLVVRGTGKEVRDFVYISDVVSALVKAMSNGEDGECYNVGSGVGVSISELVSLLIDILGLRSCEVTFEGSNVAGTPSAIIADITKAKNHLRWTPIISLKEGLKLSLKGIEFPWK